MKNRMFPLIILLLMITVVNAADFRSLHEYQNEFLNVSCGSADDCVIQNVENCCGYFPKCINKNNTLLPEVVDELCEGYNKSCSSTYLITYCSCQKVSSSKKVCVGNVGRPQIQCGDGHCLLNETIEDNSQYCPEDCDIMVLGNNKQEEPVDNDNTGVESESTTTSEPPPATGEEFEPGKSLKAGIYWIIAIIVLVIIVFAIAIIYKVRKKEKKIVAAPVV